MVLLCMLRYELLLQGFSDITDFTEVVLVDYNALVFIAKWNVHGT
jgi:hypothetical protein